MYALNSLQKYNTCTKDILVLYLSEATQNQDLLKIDWTENKSTTKVQ